MGFSSSGLLCLFKLSHPSLVLLQIFMERLALTFPVGPLRLEPSLGLLQFAFEFLLPVLQLLNGVCVGGSGVGHSAGLHSLLLDPLGRVGQLRLKLGDLELQVPVFLLEAVLRLRQLGEFGLDGFLLGFRPVQLFGLRVKGLLLSFSLPLQFSAFDEEMLAESGGELHVF